MKAPEPQGYLSEEGRDIYFEIVRHLDDADALMGVDTYGLSMAAHWLDLFHKNAERSKANDGVQVYQTGAEGISASLTVMSKAAMLFDKLSAKFGLSNKDRELMKQFKVKKKETDAIDKLK